MNTNPDKSKLSSLLQRAAEKSFTPIAYYQKHMDCIRIELQDCSICEERLNEVFTLLHDNHPSPDGADVVGLTIKGVRHLFKTLGLPLDGVHRVTQLLNEIVKTNFATKDRVEPITQVASRLELTVNMNEHEILQCA